MKMQIYSQKDPRWAHKKLGTCKDTIKQSGCKITCYAYYANKTPDEVNDILKKRGYVQGCLTVDSTASTILGIEYNGRTDKKPVYVCIAETNHYKNKGIPQHFFLYNPKTDEMADPLDYPCQWKPNKYKIVSYRLFKVKEPMCKLKKENQEFAERKGWKDCNDYIKGAIEYREEREDCEKALEIAVEDSTKLQKQYDEVLSINGKTQLQASKLEEKINSSEEKIKNQADNISRLTMKLRECEERGECTCDFAGELKKRSLIDIIMTKYY